MDMSNLRRQKLLRKLNNLILMNKPGPSVLEKVQSLCIMQTRRRGHYE